MSKRLVPLALCVAALLGLSCGCSKEEPAPKPVSRAEDPVYRKQLEDVVKLRKQMAKARHETRSALAAARAKDPASEETRALERKFAEQTELLKKEQAKARAVVRRRLQQEQLDKKQQKGAQ